MTRALIGMAAVVACMADAAAVGTSPGVEMAEHGHWKRLKTLVEPRAAAHANDAEAQYLLSRVRMAFHDADGALAPAEKAVALDANNPEYRWQLAQVVAPRLSACRRRPLAEIEQA